MKNQLKDKLEKTLNLTLESINSKIKEGETISISTVELLRELLYHIKSL